MSESLLKCCNNEIQSGDLWILKDFNKYTKRKLYIGKCSVCGDDVALMVMTSTENNKTYHNLYNGIEAVKVIYREKKRKLVTYPDMKNDILYGWIYGVNVQIKDKSGNVTQIRQYSSDFKGNRKIVKSINTNGTT